MASFSSFSRLPLSSRLLFFRLLNASRYVPTLAPSVDTIPFSSLSSPSHRFFDVLSSSYLNVIFQYPSVISLNSVLSGTSIFSRTHSVIVLLSLEFRAMLRTPSTFTLLEPEKHPSINYNVLPTPILPSYHFRAGIFYVKDSKRLKSLNNVNFNQFFTEFLRDGSLASLGVNGLSNPNTTPSAAASTINNTLSNVTPGSSTLETISDIIPLRIFDSNFYSNDGTAINGSVAGVPYGVLTSNTRFCSPFYDDRLFFSASIDFTDLDLISSLRTDLGESAFLTYFSENDLSMVIDDHGDGNQPPVIENDASDTIISGELIFVYGISNTSMVYELDISPRIELTSRLVFRNGPP
jgi:hypothetical protein